MKLSKRIFILAFFSILLSACSQAGNQLFGNLITNADAAILDTATPKAATSVLSPKTRISPTPKLSLSPNPTQTNKPTATPTATTPPIIRIGPDNFPSYINPLTGLLAVNPIALERRPIAMKIPNAPHSVRPQFGISLADQVWEYHLEWGLTRFVAIFYGNDAIKAGPIRSGRIFDAHIMDMYNAILVYNGADARVLDHFSNIGQPFDLMVVERECPPLCRDDNFPEPHNLFGNTIRIHDYVKRNGADDNRYELATNFFYSLGAHGNNIVNRIYINYSYANYAYWDFDPDTERYLRFQGDVNLIGDQKAIYKQLTDRLNGKPIVADNIVMIFAPHKFFLKSSDTEIFEIDLIDSGDAYVFRNGKAYKAKWERTAKYLPLSIQYPNGSPFPLKPGITFFQVLHTTSEIIDSGLVWTFNFRRPPVPD